MKISIKNKNNVEVKSLDMWLGILFIGGMPQLLKLHLICFLIGFFGWLVVVFYINFLLKKEHKIYTQLSKWELIE